MVSFGCDWNCFLLDNRTLYSTTFRIGAYYDVVVNNSAELMTWTMVCSQLMTLLQRACAQSLEEYHVIKKRTAQVKDIGTIIIVETILVHIAGILDRSVMYDADIK